MNRSYSVLRFYIQKNFTTGLIKNQNPCATSLRTSICRRSLHNIVRKSNLRQDGVFKRSPTLVIINEHGQKWYSSYPDHTTVALPALSPTMEMGTIISWEKKEGDQLREGDLLCEIETDKATMGFETPEEGYLAKILIPGGSKDVPVGKLVCIIVPNQGDIAAFSDYKESGAPAAPRQSSSAPPPPQEEPASAPSSSSSYPGHTPVALPALSPTMEMGTIISWEKKEGDELKEGDLLCEIETDKATMGFETPEEGFLAKILIPGGSKDVPVGKLVCIIVPSASDIAAFNDYKEAGAPAAPKKSAPSPTPSAPPPTQQQPKAATSSSSASTFSAMPSGGRVFASPLARALANERGLDLTALGKGSGFAGSITSKDLAGAPAASAGRAASSPGAGTSSSFVDTPVSGVRGTIAKRLLQSKQTIPHYYLTSEIEVDNLLVLREQFNKQLEKEKAKLSVNDFIIKAAAMACMKVPEANSSWMDKVIRQYSSVDVNVAVSTANGLITPIVFSAESKGVLEINQEVKQLAEKARAGKLQPQEFQGGTFTVSNLGMYGVHHFSAIINPPQSCILAIGGTTKKLVPADNEKGFKVTNVLYVTLSCDHRTVDGAVGAQWLQQFKFFLSNPASMIL